MVYYSWLNWGQGWCLSSGCCYPAFLHLMWTLYYDWVLLSTATGTKISKPISSSGCLIVSGKVKLYLVLWYVNSWVSLFHIAVDAFLQCPIYDWLWIRFSFGIRPNWYRLGRVALSQSFGICLYIWRASSSGVSICWLVISFLGEVSFFYVIE